MVVLEAFLLPGVGLLFAGLAGMTVGILAQLGLVDNPYAQAGLFFLFTGVWAALLWKPLRKFRSGSQPGGYQNIVGSTAVVIGAPLTAGAKGQVRWSGTTMQARLAADSHPAEVAPGQEVTVVSVEGIVLTVRPH